MLISMFKTVKFQGVKTIVPSWAEYLTVNCIGEVQAWADQPSEVDGFWQCDCENLQIAIIDDGCVSYEVLCEVCP